MSLSSTGSGRRPARVAIAIGVAVALLAPVATLCAQVWSSTGSSLDFTRDERRGVVYLAPLTRLLSAATQAQSAAVRQQPADPTAVRAAMSEVDAVDGRVGGPLRTTDRWTTVRGIVQERTSRGWPEPSVAYTQFSDLSTALLELNRTVGDNSRLILDPVIDSYYVMNATLLRIPGILVDSGRYADLSMLATSAEAPDATGLAQLSAARNRIATNATDLSDGLVRAFARTGSTTLGPGLTRQLDNFRTAVDAVAPSTSLLAPAPQRSLTDLAADQEVLQRAALSLQQAALDQLDLLLADRESDRQRTRIVALAVAAIGVLVAAGLATLAWRFLPAAPPAPVPPAGGRHADPSANGSAPGSGPPIERVGGVRAAG